MKQALQKLTQPLLRSRAEKESAGLPALMARAEKAAQSVVTGEHAQRKAGSGEKFWQFREYDSTDRPQDIDWRQSGKTDRIFVRQKEHQTIQTALFWCAGGAGMDYASSAGHQAKREDAATIALGLAILMRHGGERIGPLSGIASPGRSENALETLGRDLLDSEQGTLPPQATVTKNSCIILCGDFLESPEMVAEKLSHLAAQGSGGILIQTLDPAEIDLPFSGRAVFESPGGNERHHVFQVESVRDAYRRRVQDHLASIRALCRKYGWHWILHRTDQPVRATLSAAWITFNHEQAKAGR